MCGSDEIKVKTEKGSKNYLYEDDKCTCGKCGNEGAIHVDDSIAWVSWNNGDDE